MASPVIECPVSGRQRISLNRASLRRKRSMKAAAKTAVATPAPEKPKPRAQKTRSVALQECVKTYFASLNSISRSIVLESEALQKLFGPDWEHMNAKQQEELLNKHFMPNRVKDHYTGDRRSTSPSFCETEPEIDSKPATNRHSAKIDSIAAPSDDELCFSPKGKGICDISQLPAAVPRRKEKEPLFHPNIANSSASAVTSDDEVDTPIDRMDPVRRSFRVSSRQLAESRTRSMSMRVSRSRQQQTNRSQRNRSGTDVNTLSNNDTTTQSKPPVVPKPAVAPQSPQRIAPVNQAHQVSSKPSNPIPKHVNMPLSRTNSVGSSISSFSIPAFGRSQKYSIQCQRHHSSRSIMCPSDNIPTAQLTRYSRQSEGSPRIRRASSSALSLSQTSSAGRCVRFEDDDCASLSQCSEISERRFVPIWNENSAHSPPRRSHSGSQSPGRILDGVRGRTRSQSPGRILGDSPSLRPRGRSQSPGNYLESGSSSHLLSDTEYYADSDITSQRSITPESILENESMPNVRPSERKPVIGVHRSYSAIKNRGGSSITTTTSSFANPKKNIRRSLPRKTQHRVTDTISEVGSSVCLTPDFSMSSSQSLDSRTATPLNNKFDVCHSKTESDIGYMSAGADELDIVDDTKSQDIKSNRESGYLSESIAVEHPFSKSLPLQGTIISSMDSLAGTGCGALDNW